MGPLLELGGTVVKSWHSLVGFPSVNVFLSGDSLTQIEPSLCDLTLLVTGGGITSAGPGAQRLG